MMFLLMKHIFGGFEEGKKKSSFLNIYSLRCKKQMESKEVRKSIAQEDFFVTHIFFINPKKKKKGPVLVAFVNSKSGGKQGPALIQHLQELLGAEKVFDLSRSPPGEVLAQLVEQQHLSNLRVLVCGGDGTVSWILEEIDKFRLSRPPPVAILPLGTGNDLARTLKWGGGYEGDEDVRELLSMINRANIVRLDRWQLSLTPLTEQTFKPIKTSVYVMNNYFSLGVDAKVAKEFHDLREGVPDLCSTRFGNKVLCYR